MKKKIYNSHHQEIELHNDFRQVVCGHVYLLDMISCLRLSRVEMIFDFDYIESALGFVRMGVFKWITYIHTYNAGWLVGLMRRV